MRVFLIGMPGSGKTVLGKSVSSKTNYISVDLDELIEENSGMKIPKIFSTKGEAYFRKLETSALMEMIKYRNVIVSTGGGIITNPKNIEIMHNLGTIIYCETSIEVLEKRLKSSYNVRPLLKTTSVTDLYQQRKEIYESSYDYKIDRDKGIDKSTQDILDIIEKNEK